MAITKAFAALQNFMILAKTATEDELGLTEKLIYSMLDWFKSFPDVLTIFIISLFPILECRGGLIAASLLGVDYWIAIPVCIIGNLVPVPFIFLFIEKIFAILRKTILKKLIDKIENKAMKKSEKVTKYKRWGLLLFVGIPLPGTGAWTGALIAVLLKLNLKDSVISICLGVLMSSTIMFIISYGIPWIFSLF